MEQSIAPVKCRTGWISDLHLGGDGVRVPALLHFLRIYQFERLYVVGDATNGSRGTRWLPTHVLVVQKLLKTARSGTHVIYIPGNHDHMVHRFFSVAANNQGKGGLNFGNISLLPWAVHLTVTGEQWLVRHGDEFELALRVPPVGLFSGSSFENIVWIGRRYKVASWKIWRKSFTKAQPGLSYDQHFARVAASFAAQGNYAGVICGHAHLARDQMIQVRGKGVRYINLGCWMKPNCTFAIERFDGKIELHSLDSATVPPLTEEDLLLDRDMLLRIGDPVIRIGDPAK